LLNGFKTAAVACSLVLLVQVNVSAARQEDYIGDKDTGSETLSVHFIPLLNDQGEEISPDDASAMPYSPRKTCGSCHNTQKINQGWHFNYLDPNIDPGRPAQPWIYFDAKSGTQIPLSYRSWKGVYHPTQLGLSRWDFVTKFGTHLPGAFGENPQSEDIDFDARWMVSGELENNCAACHDAGHSYDSAEYADQMLRENFRWAPTGAAGFASMEGSARDMGPMWDPFMPGGASGGKTPPTVTYNPNKFTPDNKVFIDIPAQPENHNCLYCHSSKFIQPETAQKYACTMDVHLAAGLKCTDCHRHGLDHNITRGYESEYERTGRPRAATSSCRGCHLGEQEGAKHLAGRFTAPKAEHVGIPLVHFEKLTCTACHSGPWPESQTTNVKTARAHKLGAHGVSEANDVLPHIITPVYARSEFSGRITPQNMIWPAFWAQLDDDKVTPLPIEPVTEITEDIIGSGQRIAVGSWIKFTREQIKQVLQEIKAEQLTEAKPAYISGGKLYYLADESGELIETEHPAAQPYSWPIAHNVRPVPQSLGAGYCEDCHSKNAPFFFGKVTVDSPVKDTAKTVSMISFQDLNTGYMETFAAAFAARPLLKIIALGSAFIIIAVIALYGLRALATITKVMTTKH